MSEQAQQPGQTAAGDTSMEDPANYGTLSTEDDPGGTVDPADLAGTGGPEDETIGYRPESTAADET